jgi:hypothetical protein
MNTNKLAMEHKLSRKIDSVRVDDKSKQCVVCVEVSQHLGEGCHRTERYYYFANNTDSPSVLNVNVEAALAAATQWFLGMGYGGTPVAEKKAETKAVVTTKKKTATKTVKKEEPKPVEETEETEELEDFADIEDMGEPNVMYDKSDRSHAAALSAIITECLPANWKQQKPCTTKVRALIAKLYQKVEVMDAEGNILESFNAFCRAELS